MCGLNALFCETLVKAKMADGSIVDLLNGVGNHHEFVYGQSETFPLVSMHHLVRTGLTSADEYRMLAIGERIRSLTSQYGSSRPCDVDYINGKLHVVTRDQYVSEGLWQSACLPTLKQRRATAAFRRISAAATDRYGVLIELDTYPDAVDLFTNLGPNFGVAHAHSYSEHERKFIDGSDIRITVGTGAASKAYALYLLEKRLSALIHRYRIATHQLPDRPEFAVVAKLFPDQWAAVESGLAVFNKSIGQSKKKKQRKQLFKLHVLRQGQVLANALNQNQAGVIDAMWAAGMIETKEPPVKFSLAA